MPHRPNQTRITDCTYYIEKYNSLKIMYNDLETNFQCLRNHCDELIEIVNKYDKSHKAIHKLCVKNKEAYLNKIEELQETIKELKEAFTTCDRLNDTYQDMNNEQAAIIKDLRNQLKNK